MMASRSLSLSAAWSKPGIFCSGHWRTDAGSRISFFKRRDLEILGDVHRPGEIGALFALAVAVEAMAGHAYRHEAVEAGANAIARWDLRADRQTRPALQGTVGDRKCGEAVGPVFGTDLHRRGAAPDDVERAGARFVLLARYGRPGRRGILDGQEGLDLRRVRGGGKAARNGNREIVGGARLHIVVCVDPGSLEQRRPSGWRDRSSCGDRPDRRP